MWTVNADGTSARPLAGGDVSDNFNLAWSPGTRLLYQTAGYRNLYAIDPRTGQRQALLKDSSMGFVSCPEYSPDGQRIVIWWSGRRPTGLWTIDNQGSETSIHAVTALSSSNPLPIGWSADGTAVYAYDGKRAADRGLSVIFRETVTAARILRVPLNGGQPTTIVSLPFEEVGGIAMFPDGRRFVVSVYSSRSDAWLVDNFGGPARSRIARLLANLQAAWRSPNQ